MRDDPQARARRVEVGRLLRELRQERGLTQAALARAARMGQASLSNYEKGRRDIPSGTLLSVASALGLSIGGVLDVPHILIVRSERMRQAVRILVRSPDVLDAIVGPRPPPPPRPPRQRKADPAEQDGGDTRDEGTEADGESTDAKDGGAAGDDTGAEGVSTDADDEGTDGEGENAEGEGTSTDAEDGSVASDGDGTDGEVGESPAERETGTQA